MVFLISMILFPWQSLSVYYGLDLSDGKSIGKIVIGRTYDENLDFQNMYIELYRKSGSTVDISNVVVKYGTSGGGYKNLSNKVSFEPYYVKYELTADEMNDFDGRLMINEREVTVDFSGVPTVNQIKRTINVDIDEDGDSNNGIQYYFEIMDGNNLDNLFQTINDYTYTALFEKTGAIVDLDGSTIIDQTNSTLKIENPQRAGDYGSHNLIFRKSKTDAVNDLDIEVRNTYIKAFSFIKNLDIPDLKMYPNIGSRGDLVNFTGTGIQSDYEVYFLKDIEGKDTYNENNKAEYVNYITNEDGTSTLIVKVPSGLELTEYFVIITDTKNGEIISEKLVTKIVDLQEVPDKFVVIDSNKKASILSVTPISGPDTGQNVVIEGKNISTLNLYDLDLVDGITDYDYTIDYTSDSNYLIIKYHEVGNPSNTRIWNYKGETFSIEKRIWVNIGQLQEFNGDPILSESLDKLFINVKLDEVITKETLKDIIVGTETTFTTDSGVIKYRFYEDAVTQDGQKYTFEPSKVQPKITDVVPDMVQIENDSIKQDTLFAIYGKNFAVYRNINEAGEVEVYYPVIRIYDDSKVELEINPNEGTIRDKDGNIVEDENGIPIEPQITILDSENNILDGSDGKQIGSKIIVTLPKGAKISGIGPKDLEITNPIKNDTKLGLSTTENDILEFTMTSESPVISSVEPSVVNIDGGVEIEVLGSNFKEGVRVFLDGVEITDIEREGDGRKITFTAPPGRESKTQLQVMNPDGGMAVHDFIYVETYTEPIITDISPQEGMVDTLVILKGDNLLKPDPTATHTTELGIKKLIGTRVLLDGEDINKYNEVLGKITLRDYQAPDDESKLITINDNNQLEAADYYHSILLQQEDIATGELIDNFYVMDIQPNGTIIISDGVNDEYTIEYDGVNIKAKAEGKTYTLNVEAGYLIFNDEGTEHLKLRIRTLYEVDDENGVITGNRVKVNSKNELYFYIPILPAEGYYDVTIVNPDTKSYTVPDGFYFYKAPSKKPKIESIEPSQGSTQGGYYIEIIGKNFQDNSISKTKVYIGGILVNAEDTIVSTDNTRIKVKVPAYPGDIREETGLDRKTVPVIVINLDGGSDYKEDGFTYIIPTSHPEISLLSNTEGRAAGGDYIQIIGTDFRFYEPFIDLDGDAEHDLNEEYIDVNQNGQFDDITHIGIVEYLSDEEKMILPKVYFGDNQAEIIEYTDGYLLVKTPPGEKGNVDVYVVNNDFGVSNKKRFEYQPSDPQITDIVPDVGTRLGGDIVEIYGSDFVKSRIKVYEENQDGNIITSEKDMVLVRFGDNTNINDEESGNIVSGRATVTLEGGLTVEYNSTEDKLTVTIEERDEEYTKEFTGYNDDEIFVDVSTLESIEDSTKYSGYEFIRIKVEDRRLIVERGYSPEVTIVYDDRLEVITPSYYTVGVVPVVVINPDKEWDEGEFTYKSPDSDPIITSIEPISYTHINDNTGEIDHYEIQSTIEGGILLTIEGSDFRKGVRVFIGTEEAEIISKSNNDDKLVVRSPKGKESDLNKLLRIIIVNEDGRTVDSETSRGLEKPIYYKYLPKISNPVIESVTPNSGSAAGGDWITIYGNDFRVGVGEIEVRIGGNLAMVDYENSTYQKLVVRTPASDYLGPVDIYIKNTLELGEAILKNGFTYYSAPNITDVTPDEVYITGGQEVIIEGNMFMEGIKVYFNDIPVSEITYIDENTLEIITPPGEEGYVDIRIENSDGGTYTLSKGIKYILPIPGTPTGFRAYPGHERSIVLKWNETSGAEKYKLFGREKGEDDYKFIAETTELEYYLKDLEEDTKYYFRLWALNEYGESKSYDYTYATTLDEDEDKEDDKYDIEESEETVIKYVGKGIIIDLPTEYKSPIYNIDLTGPKYSDYEAVQINVPLYAVNKGGGTVTLKTKDIFVYIPIYRLTTSVYYLGGSTKYDDANVIIRISKLNKAEKSRITKKLSRGEKVISDGFNVEFIFQVSRTEEKLELRDDINFGITMEAEGLDKDKLHLYRFNPELNKLEEYNSSISPYVDYDRVKEMYNIYSQIREDGKFIAIYKK